MQIKNTYVGTIDGMGAIWCGFKPEGDNIVIKEVRPVLYPEPDYILERISDQEHFSSVWLKDGDVQENYREVESTPDEL